MRVVVAALAVAEVLVKGAVARVVVEGAERVVVVTAVAEEEDVSEVEAGSARLGGVALVAVAAMGLVTVWATTGEVARRPAAERPTCYILRLSVVKRIVAVASTRRFAHVAGFGTRKFYAQKLTRMHPPDRPQPHIRTSLGLWRWRWRGRSAQHHPYPRLTHSTQPRDMGT